MALAEGEELKQLTNQVFVGVAAVIGRTVERELDLGGLIGLAACWRAIAWWIWLLATFGAIFKAYAVFKGALSKAETWDKADSTAAGSGRGPGEPVRERMGAGPPRCSAPWRMGRAGSGIRS